MGKYKLNKEKASKSVQSQLNLWLSDFGDGDVPMIISDNMAYALICSDFSKMMRAAYTIGRKHERKDRSRKIRLKYNQKER